MTIHTSGANAAAVGAYPVAVEAGAHLTISNSNITTDGGVGVGLRVAGAGATLVSNSVSIRTNADAAANVGSYGVSIQSGALATITGGSITTFGTIGIGIRSSLAGAVGIARDVVINTSGNTGYGLRAAAGGVLDVARIGVTTAGADGYGLIATGAGSRITSVDTIVRTSGSTAGGAYSGDGSSVSINGGSITTSGLTSNGLHVLNAMLDATNVPVVTTGANAYGAFAEGGGLLTVTGGSFTTAGLAAMGVSVDGTGSEARLTSTAVATSGAGAHGTSVSNGGNLMAVNTNVSATGPAASALFAVGGAGQVSTVSFVGGSLTNSSGPTIGVAGSADVTLTNTSASGSGRWLQVGSLGDFAAAARSQLLSSGAPIIPIDETEAPQPTFSVSTRVGAAPGLANITLSGTTVTGAALTAPGNISNVILENNSVWNLTGNSNLTSLTNDPSQILFTPPVGDPTLLSSYRTLTVVNYIGLGGIIGLNTYLGTDGSPSDRIVVDGGTASGSSPLRIANTTGGGALTTGNGILVVDTINGGTTAAGAFTLARPVAAGPYDYTLFRSSVDASNDQAWYLRSTLDCTLSPSDPICAGPNPNPADFRPETSLYAAIPSMALLYGRNLLDTLHERIGDEESDLRNQPRLNGVAAGAWGRVIGQHGNNAGDPLGVFGSGPKFNYDIGAFQGGQDLLRRDGADDSRDHAGLYTAIGTLNGGVTHFDHTFAGADNLNAYSLGGYWTHFGARGWYLDAILQGTWYDTKGISNSLPTLTTSGWGFAGSLEAGYSIKPSHGFVIEPQAQIVYQNVSLSDGSDTAATVQFRNIDSFAARIGARLARTWSLDNIAQRSITAWFRPSLWNEFRGAPQTLFLSADGPVPFQSNISGAWFELNAGIDAQITKATSLFASAGYQVSTNGSNTAYNGKGGLRVAW